MTAKEQFGRNLCERRRRAGWSQENLASRASMRQDEVCRLENGRHGPRLETLVKLADALEVPAGDLLEGIK